MKQKRIMREVISSAAHNATFRRGRKKNKTKKKGVHSSLFSCLPERKLQQRCRCGGNNRGGSHNGSSYGDHDDDEDGGGDENDRGDDGRGVTRWRSRVIKT